MKEFGMNSDRRGFLKLKLGMRRALCSNYSRHFFFTDIAAMATTFAGISKSKNGPLTPVMGDQAITRWTPLVMGSCVNYKSFTFKIFFMSFFYRAVQCSEIRLHIKNG